MKHADLACFDATPRLNRRSRRRLGIAALLLGMLVPAVNADPTPGQSSAIRVKAAFLRNFARYVTWPEPVSPSVDRPWCIAVLGPDPFGEVLETSVKDRSEQGHAFQIVRAESPADLPICHIVFVAYTDITLRHAALAELKRKPVLTVGDAEDFIADGGVIRFKVDERVGMTINLDQARAVSLTIQTKLLEVSNEILINGIFRRVR
ncbi:YfiR family protein [Methylomonas sp. LWB]|uniref:YfiR family protein n=1 Tax=Methylomonas sp. LWB TaxID=1905845 RepID=UPI0009F371F5|nr:YfiR family protein [Methylomonas sp. LWB]